MNYLSIVITGRNDDHCSGFLRRMQNSIDMYGYFADLYKFSFEIVIVEWNPLTNISLISSLANPSSYLTIKIITVPKYVHNQIEPTKFDAPGADDMDFFLGIAQNVGIRRASGPFILTTNADIIPSESLIDFLSHRVLVPKTFYRIYRYDMKRSVPIQVGQIQSISIYEREAKRRGNKVSKGFIHKKAAGDFILAHFDVFNEVRGFPEIRCDGLKIDGEILDNMSQFASQVLLESPHKIFHQYHRSRYDKKYHQSTTVRLFGQRQRSFKHYDECSRICIDSTLINWNRESWGLANHNLKEQIL